MRRERMPLPTARRLPIYHRVLRGLEWSGQAASSRVSSSLLAQLTGFTAALVRRDLAHLGSFGTPGAGYAVPELRRRLQAVLGLDRTWSVALVGAGNLGRALLGYRGFAERGYRIAGVFDRDAASHGRPVGELVVRPMEDLPRVVREQRIAIAVLAVPAAGAQDATEVIVGAGVRGILNFAPARLRVPADVHLVNVDLTIEMEMLAYLLTNMGQSAASG